MRVLERVKHVSFLQGKISTVEDIYEIRNMMMVLRTGKSGVDSSFADVITKCQAICHVKTVKNA